MRRITKIRRSVRAISPIISTLLLIAIAVAASLVAYAWVMGYMNFTSNKTNEQVMVENTAADPTGTYLTFVYVQNVGQVPVKFDASGTTNILYIGGLMQLITGISPAGPLAPGQTATLTLPANVAYPAIGTTLKVVTADGLSTQYSIETINTGGTSGTGGATITLGISSGPAGSPVGLTGSGFADSSALTVTFNGVAATTSPATITSTTTGAIPSGATFTVPSGTAAGIYTVKVTDASSGQATQSFTVSAGSITLNPTSGSTGASVTLTGSGFADSSVITVKFDGTAVTTSPATVTTTVAGAIPTGVTFTVPSGASTGSHTVTVTDASFNTGTTTFTVSGAGTVAITITSSTTGTGFITVDTVAETTPYIANWVPGATHTIAALSPVAGPTGTQYIYTSWSDGGGQSHTYTVPSAAATVTANFQTQYQVTFAASPSGDGSTTPSAATWYNSGATAQSISAAANSGYKFSAWSANPSTAITFVNSALQSTTMTVNGAATVTASFTVIALPTLTLTPTSGSVGTSVTLSGSNYAAGTLTAKFGGATVWTGAASAGAIPSGATFAIPSGAVSGAVTVTDSASNVGTATFTVTAAPAPTVDVHNVATATSGSSMTITLTTNNPNEVLYLSIISRSSYVTGITSTLNNPTWTCRETNGQTILLNQGTTARYVSTWYAIQTSAGATTITITFNAATTGASVVAFGVSGASTSSPFDGAVAYATDSAAGTSATVSKTTANANDLIVGSVALRTTNPALTLGSGYSLIQTTSQTSNPNEISAEYKTVAASGSQTAGYTWTGSDDWAMIIEAFNPPS